MKTSFLFGVLLFISSIGFSQNNDCKATIQIETPTTMFNDITTFCLEYKTDTDTAWTRVYVAPEIDNLIGDTLYILTNYELTGLTPNTQYFVRVHAIFYIGNTINWGRYGNTITFYTLDEGGHFGDVLVPCGSLRNPYDSHPDIVSNSLLQELPERIFYRSKEEWEQLC